MGLSSAPRIFTKIIKPVFSHLRKLWYSIIAYIDDCLLQGDTCESCLRNVDQTVEILDSSPFKVSFSTIKTNSVFLDLFLILRKWMWVWRRIWENDCEFDITVSLTQDLRKWLWIWHRKKQMMWYNVVKILWKNMMFVSVTLHRWEDNYWLVNQLFNMRHCSQNH